MIDTRNYPFVGSSKIRLKDKVVLVRTDFNIDLASELFRVEAVLKTLRFILARGGKMIVMSHLGDPKRVERRYSLKPFKEVLEKYLNFSCVFLKIEEFVELRHGEVPTLVLLENLRFYHQEKECDKDWIGRIARRADVYVNEAFSVSHRKHSSVLFFPKFLPSYLGFRFKEEISALNKILSSKSNRILILGGKKVSTKLEYIPKLFQKFSNILIGGAMANNFLRADGVDIKDSYWESELLEESRKILKKFKNKIVLPDDVVWDRGKKRIFDIGPRTAEKFSYYAKDAATIAWNGPLGFFENDDFINGTRLVADALASQKSKHVVVGGGETIQCLNKLKILDKIKFVSTGGGAMLHYLANEDLPAFKYLKRYDQKNNKINKSS